MAEQLDGSKRVPKASSAALEYSSHLEALAVSAEYLRRAIAVFSLPNTTHETVARLVFDGRASVHTVKAWRIGKRFLAPWARQLLADKGEQLSQAASEIKVGPGMQAGWRNVSGYAANR